MSEADGLFVESLTAALSQSGPEAEARLRGVRDKAVRQGDPARESSIAVLEGAASKHVNYNLNPSLTPHEAAAAQPLSMQRSTDDGA